MNSSLASFMALPPPHLLLFELLASSAVVGLTAPNSLIRPATLPVLATGVYAIVQGASQHMRPRWASLLGGFSFALLLQYIDLGLISRYNYPDRGPAQSPDAQSESQTESKASVIERLGFGWHAMWSFRHVNSSSEVRNVPPFSKLDPAYVPPKRGFVLQQFSAALVCFLLLDLLAARKPPSNAAQVFNPRLVPVFSRLSEVTAAEVKIRALTIAGFAATFYCVIQGCQSFAAALAVGLGFSPVENWRPAFGSVADAYTLKNVWGKFWHQLLRRPLTSLPSAFLHDVLGIPRGSVLGGSISLFLSFALSGALHSAAGVASGVPLSELGVFRFFCTQAVGVFVEQGIISTARRLRSKKDASAPPSYWEKALGFLWVAAFMTWSGPAWIYPQAARPPATGATTFLPFSIVGYFRK